MLRYLTFVTGDMRHRPSGRVGGRAGEHRRGVPPRPPSWAPTGSSSTSAGRPTAARRPPRRPPGRRPGHRRDAESATCRAVPDLADALDACAGMGVNIEIKNVPATGLRPDRGGRRRRGRRGRDAAAQPTRVLVSSFHLATIDRVRRARPGHRHRLPARSDRDDPAPLAAWTSAPRPRRAPPVRARRRRRLWSRGATTPASRSTCGRRRPGRMARARRPRRRRHLHQRPRRAPAPSLGATTRRGTGSQPAWRQASGAGDRASGSTRSRTSGSWRNSRRVGLAEVVAVDLVRERRRRARRRARRRRSRLVERAVPA